MVFLIWTDLESRKGKDERIIGEDLRIKYFYVRTKVKSNKK
jgi:hypothetical protein